MQTESGLPRLMDEIQIGLGDLHGELASGLFSG